VSNSEARPRTMQLRVSLALAAVVMIVLGSCSGSKGNSPKSGATTPAGTDVASGVATAAATAVTTSFVRFFDPTVAAAERLTLIQDGQAFAQAIAAQASSAFAKAASVKVSKVTVTSDKRATVVYTILLSGSPVLSNQTGYAVQEGGKWKVAGQTFCELLAVQGPLPAVCKMASATTLPG
jgi:hypothetical protein